MKTRFDEDWVRRNCAIRYRAHRDPQRVTIRARWRQTPREPTLFQVLKRMELEIDEGFAADGTFSPLEGKGTWETSFEGRSLTDWIPELDAVIRVQSVSEAFIRFLATLLVQGNPELTIVGEIPPDGSSDSLDTNLLIQRDEGFTAPARWPAVPFEVDVGEAPRGASIRVFFAGDLPPDYSGVGQFGLGARLARLALQLTMTFWNRDHTQAAMLNLVPKREFTKREASISWERFAVHPDAFVNVLVNHLVWTHHEVAPVERVEFRIS